MPNRRVEHFNFVAEDFNLTTWHVGVDRACRAGADLAGYFQAELIAHGFGNGEHAGAVGVADNLCQPVAVTQVDEYDAAVIAPTVRPATKDDVLANGL